MQKNRDFIQFEQNVQATKFALYIYPIFTQFLFSIIYLGLPSVWRSGTFK